MFKTDSCLGNKKLSLNQCQVWLCYDTTFFYIEMRPNYQEINVLFSSRAFLLSTPTFLLSTLYKNSEATWKKATKCNKKCCLLRTHLWTLANPSTYYNYCLILWYHLFFLYSYDVSNASLSHPSVNTTRYLLSISHPS